MLSPASSFEPSAGPRIDLFRDTDVAYWCRLLDVEHCELRRAVQRVGPRAEAVIRYLRSVQEDGQDSGPALS